MSYKKVVSRIKERFSPEIIVLLLQSEYKLTLRGICIPRGLRTLFVQGPREEENQHQNLLRRRLTCFFSTNQTSINTLYSKNIKREPYKSIKH